MDSHTQIAEQATASEDERISCGCCRGDEGHRCVCWMHQDVPMGEPAGTCTAHAHLSTTAQPFRYERAK